jgi:SpoVK/Ycf46/Vps4 family AAA+-type ATPase
MVDFESYLQHAPSVRKYGSMGNASFSVRDDECRCASCINNQSLLDNQKTKYDNHGPDKEFMDERQYLICPPRVLGYHLETKTWLELDSDTIENIEHPRSEMAFGKLELAKTQKDLIRELVQSHTSGTGKAPMMEDIMKDKGKGLVILLHGPPGVGKTLTAESVAQLAGKPLFSVSPSDIGLNPAEVEQNLEVLFELAARWRAVLLFDEADVFLESRSSHSSDLTRNALVSVLMRVLEHYNGILILTTNRIQQFDIAVQSRVNLGIKYKDLSMEQKKKIFTNFIEQIKEDQIDDKEELERWLEEDTDAAEWFEALNGRQVRNVLFSAASLGQHSGGMLKVTHIKKMAKSTWQFQDSIKLIVQEARRKAEVGRE